MAYPVASPLSPAANTTLNFATPPTSRRLEKMEMHAIATHSNTPGDETREADSSPFFEADSAPLKEEEGQENTSPSKPARPTSRIISGTELSPLKILQDRSPDDKMPVPGSHDMAPPPLRSPRKMTSPIKRFPVKVSTSVDETPRAKPPMHQRQMSVEDAIRQNEGLKHAIEIFEDEVSVLEDGQEVAEDGSVTTTVHLERHQADEEEDRPCSPDDTMISTFSTFSAVPNMTVFAKLGHSPRKFANGPTPWAARGDPSPSRTPRAGPAPNRTAHYESGNTTSLLMDFTEQLRFAQQAQESPSRAGGGHLPHSRTTPNVHGAATPQPPRQSMVNLLDFDIPPLPTPRSVPSVTPRELESLRSAFLSEISSLKASLSGKEAEAAALQTAVGDAEKRVGESAELLREERSARQLLAEEKDEWEKRGREMEGVLRKVKEEIVLGGRERDELEAKLDEADKRREAAEMMAQEAESKMAGMRAGQAAAAVAAGAGASTPPKGAGGAASEVEMAVERVCRELHAAYKTKHEVKVAALKRSYEARWERRIRELESKIEELGEDNERLRVGRDATMTRVQVQASSGADKEKSAADAARLSQLGAEVEKLEAVVRAVQADNGELRGRLEQERVEKGELVMLAEEMMHMQSFIAPKSKAKAAPVGASPFPTPSKAAAAAAASPSKGAGTAAAQNGGSNGGGVRSTPVQQKRMSGMAQPTARVSGLKMPGASRIGRPGHESKASVGGGAPRPGSGLGMRSGIMSSIEKMGSYRGRGE